VDQQFAASDLADEDITSVLLQAREDERQGSVVHCDSEEELRGFFASLGARKV
jgi:hypothetical protein